MIQLCSRIRLNAGAKFTLAYAKHQVGAQNIQQAGALNISVIGLGRIVVWEGASLWMLEGQKKSADIDYHSHHAIQITFGLEGSFEIGISGEVLTGPVAAVGSDTQHSFRATGAVAFLFIEPESPVGVALKKELFSHRPWADVKSGPMMIALKQLRDCFDSGGSRDDVLRLGKSIMDSLPMAETTALCDPRVLAMVDYARRHLEDTVLLASAADRVHLSPSRARHLFAEQTGLPFKTFVLWLRLERATALYAAGSSLTNASHEAGFADSAHFSRTFRRTFGLPATALRLLQR